MKGFAKVKSFFLLVQCVAIIVFYCIKGLIAICFVRKPEQLANHYLRFASIKILKKVRANYSIQFSDKLNATQSVPYIFMSNHLSLMDLPLIYATLFGTIRPLPKRSLFKIPFFGRALKATGMVPIDKDHPHHMQHLYSQLKYQHSDKLWFWIFPEGTRSPDGSLQAFKQGGFRLAKELKAKIIPVGISGTNQLMPPHTFNIKLKSTIQIKVGAPIDTKNVASVESHRQLVEQVFDAIKALSIPDGLI